MDIKDFPIPSSISEMQALLKQFAPFISEEKYQTISGILAKIEADNGIKNDAEGQAILLQVLGLLSDAPHEEEE